MPDFSALEIIEWVWLAALVIVWSWFFYASLKRKNFSSFTDEEAKKLGIDLEITINRKRRNGKLVVREIYKKKGILEREAEETPNEFGETIKQIEAAELLRDRLIMFNSKLRWRILNSFLLFEFSTIIPSFILLVSTEYLFALPQSLDQAITTSTIVLKLEIQELYEFARGLNFKELLPVINPVSEYGLKGGFPSAISYWLLWVSVPSQLIISRFFIQWMTKPPHFDEAIRELKKNLRGARKNPRKFRDHVISGRPLTRKMSTLASYIERIFLHKKID